jgi:outer membrane protein OmpA-like peptidoglycan-associated protein
MQTSVIWLALTISMIAPGFIAAQQEDKEGCKDSPLLNRLAGCAITYCAKSDFDAAELMIAASGATRRVEGKVEKINYSCRGKSALQVRRNAEQALRTAGFALDFTGYDLPVHYVTGHKGGLWIAVAASELTGDSDYGFTSVLAEEMTQELTAEAKAWAAEIDKSGRVAVYGIEFDTAKATLKPESGNVLQQVLTLLNAQPGWNMRIEGHTDSTGTRQGNQVLSQQRAASVVAWLVAKGVAPARLTSAGLGDTKPVADNKSEEGRARNRRVELAKQ